MNDNAVVFSAITYLIVLAVLFAMGGIQSTVVEVPTSPFRETVSTTHPQSLLMQFGECAATIAAGGLAVRILTLGRINYMDCDRDTRTRFFAQFEDAFEFAFSVVAFLFQLLTYQLPQIPAWLNTLLILPAAIPLAWVGLKFIRGLLPG